MERNYCLRSMIYKQVKGVVINKLIITTNLKMFNTIFKSILAFVPLAMTVAADEILTKYLDFTEE